MSWRAPNDLERFLLEDTRSRWPDLIPLARLLVLAPRIEPLLLRNARRRFLPGTGAEMESQLWFSTLVSARSTREIVLHLGIACVLAGRLGGSRRCPGDDAPDTESDGTEPPQLSDVWKFTCEHTRHWTPEDRMERELRYHALRGDDAALAGGLQAILAEIARESEPGGDDARRIELSRLAKRTLPSIRSGLGDRSKGTARLLARYAALALGDAGDWSAEVGTPEALPRWLKDRLPPPITRTRLGAEIRWDQTHGQAIHLVDAAEGGIAVELPSPLPGRLHVAPGGQTGNWHPVTRGTLIPIDPPSATLRLTTLDGSQWDLVTDALPPEKGGTAPPQPLLLVHAESDREQASIIAAWLRSHGIAVDLVSESPPKRDNEPKPSSARSVRLWTRAARDLWAHAGIEPPLDQSQGLLLRTEEVDLPTTGVGPGRLFDWPDWSRLDGSPQAERLLHSVRIWLQAGTVEPGLEPEPDEQVTDTSKEKAEPIFFVAPVDPPVSLRPEAVKSAKMVNVVEEEITNDSRSNDARGTTSTYYAHFYVEAWVKNISYVKHVWIDINIWASYGVLAETVHLQYLKPAGEDGDFFVVRKTTDFKVGWAGPGSRWLSSWQMQYRLYYAVNDRLYTDGILHQASVLGRG